MIPNTAALCECGARPTFYPPESARQIAASHDGGITWSRMTCVCGIEMEGPKRDFNARILRDRWELRQAAIHQRKAQP